MLFKSSSRGSERITATKITELGEHENLSQLLDALPSIIFYLDVWGQVVQGNKHARDWCRTQEIEGSDFSLLISDWKDPYESHRENMQVLRSGHPILNAIEKVEFDGLDYWYRVDKIPSVDKEENVTGVLIVIDDISDHVEREHELKKSEDRYRAFISNSEDAIWCFELIPPVDVSLSHDHQAGLIGQRGVLSECNDRFAKLVGTSDSESLLGLPLSANGAGLIMQNIDEFISSNYRMVNNEISIGNRDKEFMVFQSSAVGVVENGNLIRVWGTTRDISATRQNLHRLEYFANHDPLTSLPNRSLLLRTMDEALSNSSTDRCMALLLIDLDRFKEINDALGHAAGDIVLKQLGPRLEVELGDTAGMVSRLGGDEFAIFLPRIRNRQHAVVWAHRFLDSICQVFEIEGFATEISASIGVALYPDHAEDASTMLRYADVAMYHSKHRLRGVSVYDQSYDSHTPKRLALMGALGTAIRENQLCLHYQPKIDLDTRKISGVEALIRWNHPKMGFIPPSEFVPIAEMSSFIYAMSSWVMEETIKQCAEWLEKGIHVYSALNLSARNLMDDRIVTDLSRLLRKYNLPGSYLEIEITESTLMSDPERSLAALEKISAQGVSLAIDDFGTGYSSLAYLKRLPVKVLKIDGSFVQNMLEDEQDAIIVQSTVQLAHNLGLKIVAECVETEEVFEHLRDLGCDDAQGYFISKPMESKEIEAWFAESSWV